MEFLSQISVPLIGLIISGSLFYGIEKRDKNRLENKKNKFIQNLIQELKIDRVQNIKQIKRIYAFIVNKNYYYLEQWIEETLLLLNDKDELEKANILEKILDDIEFQEPFSKLPEEEKDLLKTLGEYKDKDIEIFNEKLYRLSDVIKTRYKEKEKSDKWVKILGIIASVLTIISFVK
jgi:hypothetical protein